MRAGLEGSGVETMVLGGTGADTNVPMGTRWIEVPDTLGILKNLSFIKCLKLAKSIYSDINEPL